MRALVLKVGATVLTVATTMLSALYVSAHLKNPAAPLQPPVLTAGPGAGVNTPAGTLTVGPSVQRSDVQPVTSTYAS
ncbi:hypothetical protein EPN29_00265 [bacterium]|nr:MAG: hypothetical protein EPN29_00265 [bacterium]